MTTQYLVKKGIKVHQQVPTGFVVRPNVVSRVALLGSDYPGVIPVFQVGVGDRVVSGDTLFVDRTNTDLKIPSPVHGKIESIDLGARRTLQRIVVNVDHDSPTAIDVAISTQSPDRLKLVEHLLSSGLWVALRTRPFDRIPDPGSRPDWVFVNAMDTSPNAPDPVSVINDNWDAFLQGVKCLSQLATTTTFVCHAKELHADMAGGDPSIVAAIFSGPHPAGLSGTHIHHLADVGIGREAWTIGYQDVIAVGTLFLSGRLTSDRVVSVAGHGLAQTRLCRVPLGAKCLDLVEETVTDDVQMLSGSLFTTKRDVGRDEFLGRFELQLNLIQIDDTPLTSLAPGLRSPIAGGPKLKHPHPRFTRARASQSGMIATEAFERVWPFAIPPVPLLRALLSGDSETAEALGCLGLAGEDLALCSQVCVSRKNYAEALEQTLNTIREQV